MPSSVGRVCLCALGTCAVAPERVLSGDAVEAAQSPPRATYNIEVSDARGYLVQRATAVVHNTSDLHHPSDIHDRLAIHTFTIPSPLSGGLYGALRMTPGGPFVDVDRDADIFDEDQMEAHRLVPLPAGRAAWTTGESFHTGGKPFSYGMDMHGNIYALERTAKRNHLSLAGAAGDRLVAAGDIVSFYGMVQDLYPRTSHFQYNLPPRSENLVGTEMKEQGFDMSEARIRASELETFDLPQRALMARTPLEVGVGFLEDLYSSPQRYWYQGPDDRGHPTVIMTFHPVWTRARTGQLDLDHYVNLYGDFRRYGMTTPVQDVRVENQQSLEGWIPGLRFRGVPLVQAAHDSTLVTEHHRRAIAAFFAALDRDGKYVEGLGPESIVLLPKGIALAPGVFLTSEEPSNWAATRMRVLQWFEQPERMAAEDLFPSILNPGWPSLQSSP